MKIYTYLELKTELWDDLEIEDEDFVTDSLLITYTNRAIDSAEQVLIGLGVHDEYFKTKANISVTAGTKEYDLPSDIYADKITGIVFDDGSDRYRLGKFSDEVSIHHVDSNDSYRYWIDNNASGKKLVIEPAPRSTSATDFTIYYVRNANRVTGDASTIDIPEAHNYICKHIEVSVKSKEPHPGLGEAKIDLRTERQDLIEALASRFIDLNNMVKQDMHHYDEMDSEYDFLYWG